MLSYTRWLKAGYLAVLATAIVLLLSKPEPILAQRTIAFPFIPGAMTNALQMSLVAGFSGPMNSYTAAEQMLMQAGIPAGMSVGGGQGMGGGGMMGMGGGMMGMGPGMGMGGGMMGMGPGMGMGGGMMGMGPGMGMGGMGMGGMGPGMGMGGMGGFAGKGFGGFNGRKPL